MRAMVVKHPGSGRLEAVERETPRPNAGQVLAKVLACGVCRTDLHVVDGELPEPATGIVPGHEIVARVESCGAGVTAFTPGDRIGIPWLGWSCGQCALCQQEHENLCPDARFTGYQLDGGYADQVVADSRYCFRLPEAYDDLHAAPLLCAGLIGYRAYRMSGDGARIGIYGFGAAAHIVAQVASHQGRDVYAFVRPGDERAAEFARSLGATWAGASNEPPPAPLDCALIFAPVGALVPEALSRTVPGGVVVCAGIHMSDIPTFPYRLLWEERVLRSVANLTRADATGFLALAATIPLRINVQPYPLVEANRALEDLRSGRVAGAAVLVP